MRAGDSGRNSQPHDPSSDGLPQRVSRAIVTAHVLPGNARGSAITRVTQLLWAQRLRRFLGCNPEAVNRQVRN
jgi:hypothetical protein